MILLAAALLASCASQRNRPAAIVSVYDCYDWWPYVYSAPVDCWYGPAAWYEPAYFYYRPYPASATVGVPGARAARARARLLAPPERDRTTVDAGVSLPLPILHPPRTLP